MSEIKKCFRQGKLGYKYGPRGFCYTGIHGKTQAEKVKARNKKILAEREAKKSSETAKTEPVLNDKPEIDETPVEVAIIRTEGICRVCGKKLHHKTKGDKCGKCKKGKK